MIKISMTARCEAAGRQNNEDNFQLADNLGGDQWGFRTDKEVTLNEKGALMVICDGMGGMNAGETASEIAVNVIKKWFAADRLTPGVIASQATILQHIEQSIIAADEAVKEAASQDVELEGMGSTIVLAWIIGNHAFIGWCGDSRIYRYNTAGLERLSHDHSYVQELVDSGKLSKELAFEHPDSNIITRSLGDNRQKAQPDVNCFPISNGDILMLCSDGLSDVLRESEIANIISKNSDTMGNCRDALWTESEKAGWTDNVTIALCRIISGIEAPEKTVNKPLAEDIVGNTEIKKRKSKLPILILLLLLLLGIAFELVHYFMNGSWWLPAFFTK